MSIERVIYGSFPLGIESSTPGYQELTYTNGYMSIKDMNKEIHGKITTTFSAPNTICYLDFYQNKVSEEKAAGNELIRIANDASDMSKDDHPATYSFYSETINGNIKKNIFVYGKGMIDWSGGRLGNYHSAVICDDKDIKKYPILYCSSPVVCCDIRREDLFPSDGSTITPPPILSDLKSLDSPNDLSIKHSAGFEPLSVDDVIQFIRQNDNLSIFMNMLSALIQLKDGDVSKRIVIADRKENILKWIVALSIVFPLKSALNISFSTYSYSVKELDVTGVFVAELNNAKRISDDIAVTEYEYDKICSSYAVYDFQQQIFGNNVQVYDNLFMTLVKSAFTINEQIIAQYKDYIEESTTYRTINSQYMDGAILFMFVVKNKHLSGSQLKVALEFSKKYSTKEGKKNIIHKLLNEYKQYLSDNEVLETIINYTKGCIDERIILQEQIEKLFLNDFKTAFVDFKNNTFEQFSEQGRITEKFCGYSNGQLEVKFVTFIGLNSLKSLIKQLLEKQDVKRLSYVHTSLAYYVNSGKGSYKVGNDECDIEFKIFEIFINDDSSSSQTRLEALNNKTVQTVSDSISVFYYYDAVLKYLVSRNFINLSKFVVGLIAKHYVSLPTNEKTKYLTAIDSLNKTKIYLPYILNEIEENYSSIEKVDMFVNMISGNPKELKPYVSDIKKACLSGLDDTVTSDCYYKVLIFFKTCKEKFNVSLETSTTTSLVESYLQCLYAENCNFKLSDEELEELHKIMKICNLKRIDYSSLNLAYVFLLTYEMHNHVNDRGQCVFNGFSPYCIDYDSLSSQKQQSMIETFSEYISEYWINTRKLPYLQKIFTSENEMVQSKAYGYLFGEILEHVTESNFKNRSGVIVSIIKYAIYLGLVQFLDEVPEILINKVKSSDVLKPLERELELKTSLKAKKGLISEIDESELSKVVSKIREAYNQKAQNSIWGRAKQVLESIFDGFRKDKKND